MALLATVMALPLIDGVFAALVLAGALETIGGILQIGLLVFGGSAMVAVVLADFDGDPRAHLGGIALFGIALMALAGLEAAIAPTIASIVDLVIFERFAALVILAIAATTASARVGEYLPRPALIVALGLVASFNPGNATVVINPDIELMLRAIAAAGVGVVFAGAVAIAGPTLRDLVDLDRFRFGSAVALGVLPFGLLGFVPGNAPLAVLAVASVLAFDPGTQSVERPARDRTTSSDSQSEEEEDPPLDAAIANVTDETEERAPWL